MATALIKNDADLPGYWMVGGGDDDDGMCYKIGARVIYSKTNYLLFPLAVAVVQDASRTLVHETEGTAGTGADGWAPGGVIRMHISRSITSSECGLRFDALYSRESVLDNDIDHIILR
jgi:hypothetical protein